jgi:hypothetical protein
MGQPEDFLPVAGEGVNVQVRDRVGIVKPLNFADLGRWASVYLSRILFAFRGSGWLFLAQDRVTVARRPLSMLAGSTGTQSAWRSLHGLDVFPTRLRRHPVLFNAGTGGGAPVRNGKGVNHAIM